MPTTIVPDKKHLKLFTLFTKWQHKEVALSIISAGFLFLISLVINYLAGTYATIRAGNPVSDIILDNIPTFDVDGIFIYGIITFFIFVSGLVFWKPRNAPFILKSMSLFIIIRSIFISLTHIGPQAEAITISPNSIANLFTFTGDLFFSGHTGLPFLMALTFWKNKYLRAIFLFFSIILGTVTLLGHLHYSIDVFAAFFITYGIYDLSLILFKKEYNYIRF